MNRVRDLVGQRFGKLVVPEKTDRRQDMSVVWLCRCDCGQPAHVSSRRLTMKTTQSCGCAARNIVTCDEPNFGGWTRQECAVALGISRDDVARHEANALRKMREQAQGWNR